MTSNTRSHPRKVDDPHAMGQIKIREAAEADNAPLLARTTATPMGARQDFSQAELIGTENESVARQFSVSRL